MRRLKARYGAVKKYNQKGVVTPEKQTNIGELSAG